MAKHSGGNRTSRPISSTSGVAVQNNGRVFKYSSIERETEAAWQFNIGGKQVWLAKSTTEIDEATQTIEVSEAKAEKMRQQFAEQGKESPPPGKEKVKISTLGIVRETEKAALVRMQRIGGTYETWVPKSQISGRDENGNLIVPKWLAQRMTFGEDYQKAKKRAMMEYD